MARLRAILALLFCVSSLKGGCASDREGDGGRRSTVAALDSPAAANSFPPGSSLTVIPTSESVGAGETQGSDHLRGGSIKSRLASVKARRLASGGFKVTTLTVKSGESIGAPSYFVDSKIGTPSRKFSLAFDTGSDLTWVQCLPCKTCYTQADPVFDPAKSSTFQRVRCGSKICSSLAYRNGCFGTSCAYEVDYNDGSVTKGVVGNDVLVLGRDTVKNFLLGCGHNNTGTFNGTAGVLGLGQGSSSLLSRTASMYRNVFSYCLPCSGVGYLTLGATGGNSSDTVYAKLATTARSPNYFIRLLKIMVGNRDLRIDPSVFTYGLTVDSATTLTSIPPTAYASLKKAFRTGMRKQTLVRSTNPLFDTCYDLSRYSSTAKSGFPVITLVFEGNAAVNMTATGTFTGDTMKEQCLAFVGNSIDQSAGILGNLQQATYGLSIDVKGKQLGFTKNGCT